MKTLVLLICFCILAISSGTAQTDSALNAKSPTVQFLHKRGYKFPSDPGKRRLPDSMKIWPDTLYYENIYKPRLMGSPTIPISFSKIEYSHGAYNVTPTISIGYGYTWFFGDLMFTEYDKLVVDPTFFFGLIADIGLQNDFNITKPAGFFTGGFVGFKAYSLFFGYDFITRSPSIGIGGRIDVYTIRQMSLKTFGKVRELRRHKSMAVPIRNE